VSGPPPGLPIPVAQQHFQAQNLQFHIQMLQTQKQALEVDLAHMHYSQQHQHQQQQQQARTTAAAAAPAGPPMSTLVSYPPAALGVAHSSPSGFHASQLHAHSQVHPQQTLPSATAVGVSQGESSKPLSLRGGVMVAYSGPHAPLMPGTLLPQPGAFLAMPAAGPVGPMPPFYSMPFHPSQPMVMQHPQHGHIPLPMYAPRPPPQYVHVHQMQIVHPPPPAAPPPPRASSTTVVAPPPALSQEDRNGSQSQAPLSSPSSVVYPTAVRALPSTGAEPPPTTSTQVAAQAAVSAAIAAATAENEARRQHQPQQQHQIMQRDVVAHVKRESPAAPQ